MRSIAERTSRLLKDSDGSAILLRSTVGVAMQEATMRGDFDDRLPLFHVFEVEDRIPVGHPLRDI
jgi:hypothetical protein